MTIAVDLGRKATKPTNQPTIYRTIYPPNENFEYSYLLIIFNKIYRTLITVGTRVPMVTVALVSGTQGVTLPMLTGVIKTRVSGH